MSQKPLPAFLKINLDGNLSIGPIELKELAAKFGTPLYVLDEETIRDNLNQYKIGFLAAGLKNAQVAYAGKALLNLSMAALVAQENCFLDVVSQGELYTALKAGFPLARVIFHGNNKSQEELTAALDLKIGRIVVDNAYEFSLLKKLISDREETVDILFRVTPGVEAETHEYIKTAQYDSKFGIGLTDPLLWQLVQEAIEEPKINLLGLHCHIGSQIMQFEPYELSLNLILDFYQQIEQKFDHILPELNIGGGLGIRYSAKDQPLDKKEFAQKLAQTYIDTCQARAMAPPKLFIEPGRSIVAEAGLTLYQVGSIKHLPGIRTYLSVDGGMSDNIRPALYDAEYEVWAVEKALEPLSFQARIVGKHCETGDVLIKEAQLPQMEPGDILAVLATGAYNYSMASNYNRLAKPAMVMVREGIAHLVQKRESLDDLISHDVLPEHLKID